MSKAAATAVGRLANKTAIVTGAGSGFGRAIATRFAQEGARVLVSDLNEEAAHQTVGKISDLGFGKKNGNDAGVRALRFDVTKQDQWVGAVEEVEKNWGPLDILVNNAGWSYKNRPTLDVTEQDFDRVFQINVKSIFYSIPAVVPSMKKTGRGGSIINISSIGSVRPRPGLVWYNASKAAVSNATLALASEFGPEGIRVNAIAPLISGTGLFEAFAGVPYTEENIKTFVSQVPLGRLAEPADVANAALFLAGEESGFVTGVGLVVDGGKGI